MILTQSQRAVCAVTPADLEEALSEWTGTEPVLLSLAPDTLDDVWQDLRRSARIVAEVLDESVASGGRRTGISDEVAFALGEACMHICRKVRDRACYAFPLIAVAAITSGPGGLPTTREGSKRRNA